MQLRHRKRSVLFSGGQGTSSPSRRRYRPSLLSKARIEHVQSSTASVCRSLATTDHRKRCSLKMRLHAHTSCKRTAIERACSFRFRFRLSTPAARAGPSPLSQLLGLEGVAIQVDWNLSRLAAGVNPCRGFFSPTRFVEKTGIEPVTSCLQSRRSPS